MSTTVWIWLIAGAALVLSEFFFTGIIAVFFGIGALLTALAVALGLVTSPAGQIGLFAGLSLLSIILIRDKLRLWFRGRVSDARIGDDDLISARGSRVTATRDFRDGAGRVRLSGSEWSAEALDPAAGYRKGDTLWVVGHRGITLQVTDQRPLTG